MSTLIKGKQGHLELKQVNRLSSVHKEKDLKLGFENLSIKDGLAIERIITEKDKEPYNIVIAFINYNEKEENCYIETVGDRLQTYVAEYEEWQDFIMLVDEAYRLIKDANEVKDYEDSDFYR